MDIEYYQYVAYMNHFISQMFDDHAWHKGRSMEDD